MKRYAALLAIATVLVSCAAGPAREQSLVQRALDAMGGADALARVKTLSAQAAR